MFDIIRVPSKLVKSEGLESVSTDLIPLCPSQLVPISQATADPQDRLALKLFAIASLFLGAIGLVIVGLLIGHSFTPTVQPSPTIVVVPAPAVVQQPSKSSCLVLCSN